jgi:hypothetical protein
MRPMRLRKLSDALRRNRSAPKARKVASAASFFSGNSPLIAVSLSISFWTTLDPEARPELQTGDRGYSPQCNSCSIQRHVHACMKPPQHAGNGACHRGSRLDVGDQLDAALATQPTDPVVTAPDRRKQFRAIEGGVD